MASMIFCSCALNISNHFIHFSPRNGELSAKKKRFSRQRGVAHHHSQRYKITVMFRHLVSREFSPCTYDTLCEIRKRKRKFVCREAEFNWRKWKATASFLVGFDYALRLADTQGPKAERENNQPGKGI